MPSIRRFRNCSVKRRFEISKISKISKTNNSISKIERNENAIFNLNHVNYLDTLPNILVHFDDNYFSQNNEKCQEKIEEKIEEKNKKIYKNNMNNVLDELLYCYYCKCCKSFVGMKYLRFNYCSFICYVHKK